MKIIEKMIVDDIVITENCVITAAIVNDITIDNRVSVVLVGQVCGSIIVKEGASVIVMSQVGKNVINKGGSVVIMGPVHGEISGNPDSTILTCKQYRKLPNPLLVSMKNKNGQD